MHKKILSLLMFCLALNVSGCSTKYAKMYEGDPRKPEEVAGILKTPLFIKDEDKNYYKCNTLIEMIDGRDITRLSSKMADEGVYEILPGVHELQVLRETYEYSAEGGKKNPIWELYAKSPKYAANRDEDGNMIMRQRGILKLTASPNSVYAVTCTRFMRNAVIVESPRPFTDFSDLR